MALGDGSYGRRVGERQFCCNTRDSVHHFDFCHELLKITVLYFGGESCQSIASHLILSRSELVEVQPLTTRIPICASSHAALAWPAFFFSLIRKIQNQSSPSRGRSPCRAHTLRRYLAARDKKKAPLVGVPVYLNSPHDNPSFHGLAASLLSSHSFADSIAVLGLSSFYLLALGRDGVPASYGCVHLHLNVCILAITMVISPCFELHYYTHHLEGSLRLLLILGQTISTGTS